MTKVFIPVLLLLVAGGLAACMPQEEPEVLDLAPEVMILPDDEMYGEFDEVDQVMLEEVVPIPEDPTLEFDVE